MPKLGKERRGGERGGGNDDEGVGNKEKRGEAASQAAHQHSAPSLPFPLTVWPGCRRASGRPGARAGPPAGPRRAGTGERREGRGGMMVRGPSGWAVRLPSVRCPPPPPLSLSPLPSALSSLLSCPAHNSVGDPGVHRALQPGHDSGLTGGGPRRPEEGGRERERGRARARAGPRLAPLLGHQAGQGKRPAGGQGQARGQAHCGQGEGVEMGWVGESASARGAEEAMVC